MKLGKTLIIGDSYSTFEGHVPEGYRAWYHGDETEDTDIRTVEQTWWYPLFDGKENILLRNESYSGTTICNTVRPILTIDTSFVRRLDKLIADGFFDANTPDTVIVFGGTNDHWIKVPIGEAQFENFTEVELLKCRPACCYVASRLNEMCPNARICWFLNTGLSEGVAGGILEAADHYGQEHLQFQEINKMSGHPSVLGMQQIRREVVAYFDA